MHLPEAAPLALWPSLFAVQAPGDASEAHRHHALHLVLAREGALSARVGDESAPTTSAGVLTAPDVPHSIDARGREVVLVFVEPEADVGARLLATLRGPARRMSGEQRDALLTGLDPRPGTRALSEWLEPAVDRLAGSARPERRMHPRVRRLLAILKDLPPDADVSLEALGARVGLSPSRLMHVFTESVGIPLRPYVLWLRVQRAATAIVHGAPLARAASEAGFSDAAHMSRTFRGMFGLPPSALARRSQSVQARR